MKKASKLITSCAAVAASLVFMATPVLAYTVNVQGGTWNYGVGSTYVWSYYSHNRRTHKASVHGAYDASSGWTRKGIQARASAQKAAFGNKSYYDVK